MTQMIAILGFLLALLALFFASEVMRRANHKQSELELALVKANARLQKVEARMSQVDRLATEIRHEKKRQAETMTALANKTGGQPSQHPPAPKRTVHPDDRAAHERFTPSAYKTGKTG